MLEVFNDVFSFNAALPGAWRRTKLVVIFKKGDPKLPANYRPIAILPIMYKLFSRMLCERLMPHIMQHQSVDQAAYRKGYSTEDHLLTVSLLVEKSNEYNFPLWFALVDFEKAFDSVEHKALLDVLRKQDVPKHYVDLIGCMYEKQAGFVQAGAKSREFSIGRGVKQGDPISALLFVAVMQDLLGDLQRKWDSMSKRRNGHPFGMHVGAARTLTNLRFADDVVLVAQSRGDIKKMLGHFALASRRYGLNIHFGKTKVMTWDVLVKGSRRVNVRGVGVAILKQTESEKYLGRKFCFESSCEVELSNRIAASWAAFHRHKGELCSKHYSVYDRLRLFNAVVTPVLLYGSSAWTLTKSMEQSLKVVWRKMLRYVFCVHRRKTEDWVDYMQRSASVITKIASNYGVDDWVALYRRKKFAFACRVAGHTDSRWTKAVLEWVPPTSRNRGRPDTRWSDDLDKFAGHAWRSPDTTPAWRTFAAEMFALRP